MPETAESAAPAAERKRRRRPLRALLLALAAIIAAALLAALALLAVNALDRRDPASFLPPRPDAYASVRSLGEAVTRLTGLRAADELLAGPGEAELRALLVAARSAPFLSSKAFGFLASVPAHAAVQGDTVVAAVDLGLAGAAARLLPLVGPLLKINDLAYEYKDGVSLMLIGEAPSFMRLAVVGRVLLASTSAEALAAAIARGKAGGSAAASDASSAPNLAVRAKLSGLELSAPRDGAIRIIADISGLVSRLAGDGASSGAALADLKFPSEAVLDLDISDDSVSLEASLPVESRDPGLSALLARRSGVPAVLTLLPEATAYASLAAAATPASLLPIVLKRLGEAESAAYAKAESACKAALGVGFDGLLLSWAGDEFGAFGLEGFADPVFYVRVSSEAARKAAFDKLVSSALVGEDLSTVVDELRIPRLVLPWYARDALKLLGVDVPEPYWIAERGFLFASSSAETLRAVAGAASSGKTLPRSSRYRSLIGQAGSDAAAAVFYSLDRGVPFFLRGTSAVERVLRLYGNGALFVRTGSSKLGISLRAARGAREAGLRELPGFPIAAGGRLTGAPLVLGEGSRAVAVLPLAGGRVVAVPLAGGAGGKESAEAKLDADAWLLAAKDESGASFAWALTRQGTVYRLDPKLEHLRPFPIAASARPSSPPALAPSSAGAPGLAFGLKGGGIAVLSAAGEERRIELPGEAALLSPPSFSDGLAAAYPKAFDGRLYLLGAEGSVMPGWPVPAGGIAFGSPVFASGSGGTAAVAFLTQAGELTLRGIDGALLRGFPMALGGSFRAAPAARAAAGSGGPSLYLLDAEGLVLAVSASGEVVAERREEGLRGGEASLAVARPYGDGREVLFAAGSGDGLYAYSPGLEPLPGFPAKGAWLPALADIDGDGSPEIVTGGIDDTIHAYALR
jgi:hypothetical protein